MGMMPMMAPMMPMGMNPMASAAAQPAAATTEPAPVVEPVVERPEPPGGREQFIKELEATSAALPPLKPEWEQEKEEAATPLRVSPLSLGLGGAKTGAASSAAEADRAEEPKEALAPQEPPRCHLHPQKKPNAKCKFCQRAQGQNPAKAEEAKAAGGASATAASAASASKNQDFEDYSRRTFNCSPMLKDQIFGSSYFKSLLSLSSIEELIDEIANYADTLDVYNAGSQVSPSCFICQVYRLFTLPQAEDLGELQAVVDHPDSALVRCAGFLYMRFVVAPVHLWEKLEEYLFDDMELKYADGGKQVNSTIGEYVEALLGRDRYFSTPLPRIPVKVRQALERELAPLQQYRKRMEANLRAFPRRVSDLAVEVCVDGDWVAATAREYVGRASQKRKVRVNLKDGSEAMVHLGKVVLREGEHGDSGESGSEGKAHRRRRSRSRGRRSPDWSRYKGRSDQDMVVELREKTKEEAVCGHGKAYARRPLTVEEELWKREPETRVSMLGDESRGSSYRRMPQDQNPRESEAARRRRLEEEDERQKRLRGIYEKYGSASKSASSTMPAPFKDVDEPDVLRLG
mmetsp:Transcript_115095/g.357505  ORF Transcript_115095/g.357505 Transcript_115095/m.357505 type:complete len:574 (+) Transcript_115095:3-1724(+)